MEILMSPSELLDLSAFTYLPFFFFFKLYLLVTANTSWFEFQWPERPRRRLCCTFLNDTWVWPSAAATIMERWQSARCRCSRQTASPCMRRVNLWPWSSRQLRFCRPRSELKQMTLQFTATFTFIFRKSKAFCVPSHKDPLLCTTAKPGLFYRPAQKANNSCSRSTGSMLCSPSRRQITKCTGAWRTRCHAQVSVPLINT